MSVMKQIKQGLWSPVTLSPLWYYIVLMSVIISIIHEWRH